jgi:hypothetical protein
MKKKITLVTILVLFLALFLIFLSCGKEGGTIVVRNTSMIDYYNVRCIGISGTYDTIAPNGRKFFYPSNDGTYRIEYRISYSGDYWDFKNATVHGGDTFEVRIP